jgi:cbb3-type cytochrome c oxidase subunit III
MKFRNRMRVTENLLLLILGVALGAAHVAGKRVLAQTSDSLAPAAGRAEVPIDEYQRSAQVFYMQRMGQNGWQRGQEIYLMKCWICHNDYAIKADPRGSGPTLRDLYKRPKLMSGSPVNDQTVAAQIRNGSARMPAYRHILSEKDVSDLVTYLREKCCWDENNPPANPRYHP